MDTNKNVSKWLVYCLVDPRNGDIRYVGKSSSGLNRPKHHLHPSAYLKQKAPVYNWIKKLLRLSLGPTIEILEETTKEDLSSTEIYYIALCKREGNKLLNLTNGGDGPSGRKMSEETKNKISKANKNRKPTQRSIEASRIAGSRKHSDQEKEKASISSPKRKHVLCIETGITYDGVRRAAKALNLDHRGIGRCCSGEYKQYSGFTWKFI